MPDAGLGDRLHGDRCEMGATGKQHLQALEPIRIQRRGMHITETTYQQQARRWSGQVSRRLSLWRLCNTGELRTAEQNRQDKCAPARGWVRVEVEITGGRHRVWLESRRWRSPFLVVLEGGL